MRSQTLHDALPLPTQAMAHVQRILVFDSGIGGLSVLSEIQKKRPYDHYIYLADNAAFPYGQLSETVLVARVSDVIGRAILAFKPDVVVIACNTASTLVLPTLRSLFDVPFVGTVPAIKPAALTSRTKYISVLATLGTVARDYTHGLIRTYAADCHVTLVGSQKLATLAERDIAGLSPSDDDIWREMEACFVHEGLLKTDTIVLGCTHYPMLRHRLETIAPWTVAWIDSGAAIARRVNDILNEIAANADLMPLETQQMFAKTVEPYLQNEDDVSSNQADKIDQKPAPHSDGMTAMSRAIFTSASGVNDCVLSVVGRFGLIKTNIQPIPLDN
jgi:glutamate racemase